MKNLKNKFILASAILALASCADNSYLGDQEENPQGGTGGAIAFNSGTGNLTRATSNTAATSHDKLDNQFIVYGVKSGETAGSNLQKVFVNYGVWYVDNSKSTSNSTGWEYVEPSTSSVAHGTNDNPMGISNQTIKYWDQNAADYRFVAGSPYKAFTFNINSTTNVIESATITGLAGHINANTSGTSINSQPIYVAKPKMIAKANYPTTLNPDAVRFEFVRQQTFVRVGFYETVPGYKITNIRFYKQETSDWETTASSDNIILTSPTAGYFVGGSTTQVKGTIAYTWGDTPSYSFTYDNAGSGDQEKLVSQKNWYGGAYNYAASGSDAAWEMAKLPTETVVDKLYGKDNDRGTDGYFTVLPTPNGTTASAMTIKCDYTLTSEVDGSSETINIKGATATIPADYSLWKPNFSYTYLFKITDDKLIPITLDAVVLVDENGNQETITTVTNPSITTYAKASNVTTNNEYLTNSNIYVVVENGTAVAINNTANLYTATLDDGSNQTITETSVANALANGTESPTGTWTITDTNNKKLTVTKSNLLKDVTEIAATDAPNGNAITINGAMFKPTTPGTYVFQYAKTVTTAAAYTAVAANTTLTSGNTYYTSSSGSGIFVSDGTEVADGNNYYELTTAPVVSEWIYKVIKVVAAPANP